MKDSEGLTEAEQDLKNLKEQLHDDFPVGPLIGKCCTLDQVYASYSQLYDHSVWPPCSVLHPNHTSLNHGLPWATET